MIPTPHLLALMFATFPRPIAKDPKFRSPSSIWCTSLLSKRPMHRTTESDISATANHDATSPFQRFVDNTSSVQRFLLL